MQGDHALRRARSLDCERNNRCNRSALWETIQSSGSVVVGPGREPISMDERRANRVPAEQMAYRLHVLDPGSWTHQTQPTDDQRKRTTNENGNRYE